ncbi:hypothetical protein BsWGS_17510 [Bradybaena similaris]
MNQTLWVVTEGITGNDLQFVAHAISSTASGVLNLGGTAVCRKAIKLLLQSLEPKLHIESCATAVLDDELTAQVKGVDLKIKLLRLLYDRALSLEAEKKLVELDVTLATIGAVSEALERTIQITERIYEDRHQCRRYTTATIKHA